MPEIILTHVTKRWDKFYAVDDLNLVIDDNAFVTLLGLSLIHILVHELHADDRHHMDGICQPVQALSAMDISSLVLHISMER